jgi:diguanylate cyclase (GGDEF)-like protein/PAS domain S-box-containing protein
MDTVQAGVLLIDVASHTIVDANPAACLMIGATRQEICGKVCNRFICPAEKGHCPITDLGQQVDNSERLLLTCRGEHLPILKTVVPLYMGGKKYLLESFMDISDRKRAEEELSESRATFHAIIEKSLDGIIIVDTEGDVQFLNQAAADLFNLSRQELLGTQLSFPMSSVEATEINFVHPGRGKRIAEMRMAETRWKGKQAYVATLRDITGRKKMEESIRHLANHDALTGLPNRNLFEDRLRQSIRRARRHDYSFALLYMDLDDFKPINDNLGHRAGDMVLQEVARRLRQSIREPDTVARVGGDEFVIILDRINQAENAAQVAGKIIELLTRQPYHLPEKNFLLGASIGISLYPEHGKDMQSLMRCADIAMYTVKEKGKNSFAFYDGRQKEPAAEST